MRKKTTAVILAAGKKHDFGLLEMPKPLILVSGKPLILYKIESLLEEGIEDIIIVGGPYINDIKSLLDKEIKKAVKIKYLEQPNNNANIQKSLLKIKNKINGNCIITSCDLIFENNPFKYLSGKSEAEMLIDKNVFHNKFCGASIFLNNGLFKTDIGVSADNYNAINVGIYGFNKAGFDKFIGHIEKNIDNDNFDQVLSEFHKTIGFKFIKMPKMTWFDINTPETLIRAEMFHRGQKSSNRPTTVDVDSLKKIKSEISFHYKKEDTTKVLVEPGLINKISDLEIMNPERTASNHILITDEIVDELYGGVVEKQMREKGYKVMKLVAPVGEIAKSMPVYKEFAEKIIASGIDEQSVIFALGGGVVANLSGFLAATLYRGIGLIHIPTTFMNMVDVSISLKQGINGQKGKNLVGSYYQPLLVLIDPAISVPDWLVRDGISETIKHAVCQDKEFFDYLVKYKGDLSDVDFRTKVIKKTIDLKIFLMENDMYEQNAAMILQYGHEIGHAIEFLSKFDLTHGEAISIGMRVTAELSYLMDVTDKKTVEDHKKILKNFKLPISIPEKISKEAIIDILKYNKKNRGSDVRVVLPEYTGKTWKIKGEFGIPCPLELIEKAIDNGYN